VPTAFPQTALVAVSLSPATPTPVTPPVQLPLAFDPILLDAMPDLVGINRYTGDDANGNAQYGAAIVTRANIVVERSLVELRLGRGMRLQATGMDIYIPAPVTMATLIIPAQGILPKDKFTFTVGQTYERFVMFVTVNRDQFGQPWTETCIVQITKE